MEDPNLTRLVQTIFQEIYIQQLSYVYAFLHLALKTCRTAKEWTAVKPHLQSFVENSTIGSLQYPYLDLTSRASAAREKKKWCMLFQETTHEHPHHSERVLTATYWIRKNVPF